MAGRYSVQRVKAHRNYTVTELADAMRVTAGTIRNWVKDGLPILTDKRPFLILGCDVKAFLARRVEDRRRPLGRGQVYCMSCRDARTPEPGLVELRKGQGKRMHAKALCSECGSNCCRVIGANDLAVWADLAGVAKDDTPTD